MSCPKILPFLLYIFILSSGRPSLCLLFSPLKRFETLLLASPLAPSCCAVVFVGRLEPWQRVCLPSFFDAISRALYILEIFSILTTSSKRLYCAGPGENRLRPRTLGRPENAGDGDRDHSTEADWPAGRNCRCRCFSCRSVRQFYYWPEHHH